MLIDLKNLGRGFASPARDSQAVFRTALQALSRPGLLHGLPAFEIGGATGMQAPQHGNLYASSLLLALLDQDCSVWLSQTLMQGDAPDWLRFHTGCTVVSNDVGASQADFVWVAMAQELPELSALKQGTAEYPDQSATVVLQVDTLDEKYTSNQSFDNQSSAQDAQSDPFTLTGPGINETVALDIESLSPKFAAQWKAMQVHFPCGLDAFIASETHCVGLPRTTILRM